MDSEKFSGRNQSIGCALAWVTIALDSESDYPFNPVGQFHRICADQTNVGHPAELFKGILIDSNLPVIFWHPWSFIVVLTAPKTSYFDLIWFNCIKAGLIYISPTKLGTGIHVFFLFWKKEGIIKINNKPEINKKPYFR